MANQVISEQAFLDLLTEIQNNSHTLVVTQYHDPSKFIEINLDTREIELKNSEYKEFISVNKDHYAETLYFKVPRYYDDVDLMNMALVVEYVNAKGDSYLAPILTRDIHSYPGYIIFGWNIHGNATIESGTLQFAFRFFKMDVINHRVVYSLRTRPVSGKIAYGITTKSSEIEQGLVNNYSLDEILSEIHDNTTLWWNNL